MRLQEHGWQQCWCAPGTGEALGGPGGPRLLRGQGRQRVCNTQGMDGGVPARKQSPPVLGGDRCFQSVPAAPGLVPRGEEAYGGVGCQSSMWPPPTQDQCIALLPALAKFLAARGAVMATDVCPQYLMLCRHHVGTATLHEQLPSLCFAHLVLKGEAIPP